MVFEGPLRYSWRLGIIHGDNQCIVVIMLVKEGARWNSERPNVFSGSLRLWEMFGSGQLYLYGAWTGSWVSDVASFRLTLILKVFCDISRTQTSTHER